MNNQTRNNLKIIMAVANNTYPSDVRVKNEAQTLAQAGHRLTVIAPKAPAQPYREVIDDVQVVRYPAPPEISGAIGYMLEFLYVTLATTVLLLWQWLRHGLDVFHVHNPPDTLFIAAILPRLFGKRFVYDHHDLAPELYLSKFQRTGGLIYRVLLGLEYLSCRLADHVITVNESYKQNDIERNHVAPHRITIVRNAPLLKQLEPVEPDSELQKRADVLVGYLGHIAPQDGVDHLITALHHVENDFNYKDWYAVIVGAGEDLTHLQQLAHDLGIGEKVWFTGYQPYEQWRKLLASVDICFVPDPANPLNEKSTMIKTMDYMALGKPVIAYDMVENRVSAGDAGLYAQPSEPRELAQQFMALVQDPNLRHRLGRNGRIRIREELAWEYSADALVNLYNSGVLYGDENMVRPAPTI
jgi:glycosyltransferase involved in cell wall biosynthesis